MNTAFRKWGSLAVAVLIPLAVGALAGAATSANVTTWYPTLTKPTWTPPARVFAPVWTVLYIVMGTASWLVYRADAPLIRRWNALVLYLMQLLLNGSWSFIFFAFHRTGWALVDIVLLCVVLAVTTVRFHRINRWAGWLLLPYVVWVVYAMTLNAGIVVLN